MPDGGSLVVVGFVRVEWAVRFSCWTHDGCVDGALCEEKAVLGSVFWCRKIN